MITKDENYSFYAGQHRSLVTPGLYPNFSIDKWRTGFNGQPS